MALSSNSLRRLRLAAPSVSTDAEPTNRRPQVTVRSLLSTHFLVAHSRDTRPRIMRSIRIGVVTSGHGARAGAVIRQFLEVRRGIHRPQRGQQLR